MRELAIVICVVASVVSVVTGLFTLRRRGVLWKLTSTQQFGGAVLPALVAAMLSTHSVGLDLTVVAFGLAIAAFSVYALHVKSGSTASRRGQ